MDDNQVATRDDVAVSPFSFDFGKEFAKENLPAEKQAELAVVAQNRRLDLAQDVAERTIRLQASNADMDQTLSRARELSQMRSNYVVRSTHETASGKTVITVSSRSTLVYIILGIAGVILLLKFL